ncbi:MAG: M20 family peptidase [Cytophagaceae bacterium]|nr:M20 family peptidase [Cytophagaceae bacterium]
MKKAFGTLLALIILFAGILLIKTLRYESRQSHYHKTNDIEISETTAQNLSESIRIKTISYDNSPSFDSSVFNNFLIFLEDKFPLCDSLLDKKIINNYSVLYKWKGKNKALKPAILLAHIDVVPAEGKWQEDPFSGLIKDNYIWGRGSLDDKVGVLGTLEAAEILLKENFKPERTVYFAFGHDEEVMGKNGAKKIAEWLKEQKVEAEFILDEGLVVTEGLVPGIENPVALIGIAEKGYLTLKLSVKMHGGHSSMPENETSLGVLSEAISQIERNKPDAKITPPVDAFLSSIGPEMPFAKKIIFANRWLFESAIINTYENTTAGNALVRTTVVPTIISSGVKENVIPDLAEAIVNLRTLPGESNSELIKELKNTIGDERIKIEVLTEINPSSVSPTHTPGFNIIDKSIKQVFPNTYVAPSLMIAGTDSKHYSSISKNIYRFLPIRLSKNDLTRIHGSNERIKVEDYKNVIRFYYQLMKNI